MTPPAGLLAVTYGLPAGGAEKMFVSLLHGLDRSLFSPAVVSLGAPGLLDAQVPSDCPFHRFERRGRFDMSPAARIAALLREKRYPAALVLDLFANLFVTRARNASGVECPAVVSQHTLHVPGPAAAVKTFVYARSLRSQDVLVTLSQLHADTYATRYRVPRERIRVIPNGVDTTRFTPDPSGEEGRRVRRELGIPSDAPVIVQVAALRPEKRHELALDALEALNGKQAINAHLILVGDGPPGRMAALKNMADRKGIGRHVHFAGFREDVRPFLRGAELFTLTSAWEAFPVSVLEALACGVPCVATSRGGAGDIIGEGVHGHIVPPDDVRALVAAWEHVLTHPRTLAAGTLHDHVARHFSLAQCVRAYEEVLHTAVTRRSGRAT